VLEPYAVKVARTVLRREGRGNPPDLSDQKTDKLTTSRRFKLTTLRRSKLTTPRRSKLTT
jgi:hypothetical protein